KVYPSQGNFLLLKSGTENILAKLLDKGIKVRDCSQFYGLSSEYFRIAIRKHSENKVLIKALTEIFL
ncbi:MAG: cobyric acid decarboxylase, partial [Anaerotignum sp.]|nr:cobyric acid decarboxylase [Anaerotignum sp.]